MQRVTGFIMVSLLVMLGVPTYLSARQGVSVPPGWIKHSFSRFIYHVCIPTNRSTIVYAATEAGSFRPSGVFVSNDSGKRFKAINRNLPERIVKGIAVMSTKRNCVYVALSEKGVYRSCNQGKTWGAKNKGLPVNIRATCLSLNPQAPRTLLLGLEGGELFRTVNGADSWTRLAPVSGDVSSIAFDPKNLHVYYVGMNGGRLYKSTDAGATWNESQVGASSDPNNAISSIVIDPITPSSLYLSMTSAGIWKSFDSGATWSEKMNGLSNPKINALVFDAKHPLTLYAGTAGSGVFALKTGARVGFSYPL